MRRQYSGNHGARPRDVRRSGHGTAASARLFMCAECHAQALICSCCDRGQIYCAGDCAARARRRTRRDAGRRYQTSRRGRLAHAEPTRRYRVRCKNVTHHGSPPSPPDDLLSSGSPAIASDALAFVDRARRPLSRCDCAGGAARISSVKGSCVAAAVAGGCHDMAGWDAAMVTPPMIHAWIGSLLAIAYPTDRNTAAPHRPSGCLSSESRCHRRQYPLAHAGQHRMIGPRRLCHKVQQRLMLCRGTPRRGGRRQRFDALAAFGGQ